MIGCTAVIGACFGDEGKGLVTDGLCNGGRTAVVRHNGGAQAGHTVVSEGRRFVFHQLGAGSFRGADTIWAESFMPDLYKLGEEAAAFCDTAGFVPRISACSETAITLIDDVLVNMALETSRGDKRHGSCGMGINEADLRRRAGFGVDMGWLKSHGAEELYLRMREIRREYVGGRLAELGLDTAAAGEYGELLCNDGVLRSAAEQIAVNLEMTELFDGTEKYEKIVFEGAQGLLLDAFNTEYAPHTTASRTGLDEPLAFCERHALTLDRAVYVIRSYLTRHGAGRLDNECSAEKLGRLQPDMTNLPNPWQGTIRYAPHASPAYLLEGIRRDLGGRAPAHVSLAVTHLNETDGNVRFASGDIPFEKLSENDMFSETFDSFIASRAEDELTEE